MYARKNGLIKKKDRLAKNDYHRRVIVRNMIRKEQALRVILMEKKNTLYDRQEELVMLLMDDE